MRRLAVFNHVTLDGYIADAKGDMSWAHRAETDAEWNEFVEGNASGGGVLLFGRVTYDLMADWWPTPQALAAFPVVAERINAAPKVVFSRTLARATWSNTTLVRKGMVAEVRAMKEAAGPDMTILGSGSVVAQLAAEGLVDEFQLVVNPVALGRGRTMFEGLADRLRLRHARTRTFGNGNVLLCYEPVR